MIHQTRVGFAASLGSASSLSLGETRLGVDPFEAVGPGRIVVALSFGGVEEADDPWLELWALLSAVGLEDQAGP